MLIILCLTIFPVSTFIHFFWSFLALHRSAPAVPFSCGLRVWRKSRFKLIENRKSDIVWLFLHRVVRVSNSLKTWEYINNDKCALCGRVETIKHCFLTGPRATCVWLLFAPMVTYLTDVPFLPSALSVLFYLICTLPLLAFALHIILSPLFSSGS